VIGPQSPKEEEPVSLSVLVVDAHRARAEAVGVAIDGQHDLRWSGTVQSVPDALARLDEVPADVAVLESSAAGDVIASTRALRSAITQPQVVLVTGQRDPGWLLDAAEAGAGGFVSSDDSFDQLVIAIRIAATGRLMIGIATLMEMLDLARSQSHMPSVAGVPVTDPQRLEEMRERAGLTPRERDVLLLLGEGLDPTAIARELIMSIHTARGHVKNIMMKLGVHSQLEAVVTAARLGLLPRLTVP
jgi:DNA-binding NarL/FixJ family response regulator